MMKNAKLAADIEFEVQVDHHDNRHTLTHNDFDDPQNVEVLYEHPWMSLNIVGKNKHCTINARTLQGHDDTVRIVEAYSDFWVDGMEEYIRVDGDFRSFKIKTEELLKPGLKFELKFKPSEGDIPLNMKLTVHKLTFKLGGSEKKDGKKAMDLSQDA
ncbi:hypothetical protein RF11_15730 [Thelohanellus kitauei]|uniref:Uncharacterized protein n=1 Tax=Thelohanellus kitauei TaxID=669202 RepID=A0A0C2MRS6_THEKT|nr:hypothetical protein RF11_15730 [Thelohanellus kitauei]